MKGYFDHFVKDLAAGGDLPAALRAGLIGEGATFDGPFGPREIVYADYVASGRALRQIEHFVLERVLPYYANSHTEASHCGAHSTRLREAARAEIARVVGAGPDCSVIFAGSGATSGINRLVRLLDISERVRRGERVSVLTGPYEHHSNILPWRESGAEVVEIPEAEEGGPDRAALTAALETRSGHDLVVTAFSAASNVSGIVSDVAAITRLIKAHGGVAIWDYAGGAPYLPMTMQPGGVPVDAIVFSPHKFVGGPGASGVLIVRNDMVRVTRPTAPGGGSVTFVSPWGHDYSTKLCAREEAGTPNVVGDIRAALCLIVKEALGQEFIDRRNAELHDRALAAWRDHPRLVLLGNQRAERLPIFSFRVRDGRGDFIHHQLFTRMLSDVYGIQARGGCACAGPYAHRLLGIGAEASRALHAAIRAGREIEKPGWVRLNFSYLMNDRKADLVIEAVDRLAREAEALIGHYSFDSTTARFRHEKAA